MKKALCAMGISFLLASNLANAVTPNKLDVNDRHNMSIKCYSGSFQIYSNKVDDIDTEDYGIFFIESHTGKMLMTNADCIITLNDK